MSGLTEGERRGARVLAVLLALGTLSDLYRARHPEWAPAPESRLARPASAVTEAAPVPSAPAAGTAGRSSVDLNRATVSELEQLPGIGPVLAARIVEHRVRNGRFLHLEELLAVPGIGPHLLERLRPWLRDPAP